MENKTDRFFEKGFISATLVGNTNDPDYPDITENSDFALKYDDLMREEGNRLDALNRYRRSVIQTLNLGAAILILGVLVYRQQI